MACILSPLSKLKAYFLRRRSSEPNDTEVYSALPDNASWTTLVLAQSSQSLAFDKETLDGEQFWRDTVGKDLSNLMQGAGYESSSRERGLSFCSECVFPYLGPAINSSRPAGWRSFMTDDFSPVEYSWTWDSSPQIRFSWEPVGQLAGSPLDPFNRTRPLECSQRLRAALPNSDWTWFDALSKEFYDSSLSAPEVAEDSSSSSAIMFAAELARQGQVGIKAYLVPVVAEQTGRTRLSILSDAVGRLETASLSLPAYKPLESYIQNCEADKPFHIIGIAIDMVVPELSRLKIYLRGPKTSFSDVCSVLTLDGTNDRWTSRLLEELRQLWYLIFNLDDSFCVDSQLPQRGHETEGILYNLDVQANNETPDSKVYIPVKHYSKSDRSALSGLITFISRTEPTRHTQDFVQSIERLCAHRDLSAGRGLQTYIACAVKRGKLSLTSYISPELFHQGRHSGSSIT